MNLVASFTSVKLELETIRFSFGGESFELNALTAPSRFLSLKLDEMGKVSILEEVPKESGYIDGVKYVEVNNKTYAEYMLGRLDIQKSIQQLLKNTDYQIHWEDKGICVYFILIDFSELIKTRWGYDQVDEAYPIEAYLEKILLSAKEKMEQK